MITAGPKPADRINRTHIAHQQRQASKYLAGYLKQDCDDPTVLQNINYWQGQADALASLLDI